ncbi:hypothetical protein LguiA_007280 [Lonicera macranthoides]
MVEIEEVSELEAAAIAASASSSSSSAEDHHIHRWRYDVFLSFRGKDIRKTFIDHLYSALERSGIYTFKDDERLETGESISPALLKAIEESSFAVVVFSKNYASSQWCLDELVKIMECSSKSPKGQTVIPIFYDVKPSDVREQEGHFGEMFRKHDSDMIQIWRKTLTDAANLSGLELDKTVDGHESKFIYRIVQKIWSKLPFKLQLEDEVLVGMKSRIEEVTLLLGEESNVVRTVGIWGLSGIGKSTLAKAVYGQIKDQFEVAYFLDEVGEASKKDGLRSLQQHLLSETLGVKDLHIANNMAGIALMKTRLRSRRVLLVLDDVDSSEQLEALAGSHEWFGSGSRIIITTRDRKLLVEHNEVQIHDASLLDYVEATKLFRWKAFNNMCPAEDFEKLSLEVIEYCGRLPLALKVLGSTLHGENLDFWKALLEKLRKVGPDGNILKKLKIGYDGLEESVQNTFLDIACFFEGREKEHVTRILDSFDFYPGHSIPILVHRSLIHCSGDWVYMHQLIREMGRHTVRQNFPREPGKYSRLWDTSDIEHVLTRNTGTKNIEGILLDPKLMLWDIRKREYTIEMGTKAFRKMAKLRLLEIHYTHIPKGPDYLPNELRWIDWDEYPSNYLPTTFEADNLVGLRLHRSGLRQLWEGRTSLFQLRKCQKTTRSLVLAPIWGLTSLTSLDLTDCNLLEGAIPSGLGSLFSLEELCLGGNNFENLPSLNQLSQLAQLELNRCKMLRELPELPSSLNKLFANDCASLRVSADRFAMCKMEYGWFQDCKKLLDYGESEILANTLLQQKLLQSGHLLNSFPIIENIVLPGRVIPECFCNHTFMGDSVLLKLPRTSTGRVVIPKSYIFFVILEVINKVKSCNLSKVREISGHIFLRPLGMQYDSCNTGVGVELTLTKASDDPSRLSIRKKAIFLRNTGNLTCQEHTIMGFEVYYDHSLYNACEKSRYKPSEIEVVMRPLSPDTVVVKKWGIRLQFNDDYEEVTDY